jgi:hypothetical protein
MDALIIAGQVGSGSIYGLLSTCWRGRSTQPFVDCLGLKGPLVKIRPAGACGCQRPHPGKTMKRLSIAILCCFLLAGCVFDPVFDTSSWEAYQRSSVAIRAKLGNDDLRRLDIALKYLTMESMPRIEFNGPLLSNASLRGNLVNPIVVLGLLGPRIKGKSASALIKDLSIRLDAEILQTEARLQSVESVSEAVEVSSSGYYWKKSGYLEQPVIEFSVRNGGKSAISRIYFRLALTSPGRSIPWAKQDFVQTFKGGLEPREKQQLNLQPRTAEWSDPQLKVLPNAELKVTVVNFEDATGEKVIAVDSDNLDLKRKVRAALQ